jgi:hypothetical protein
MRYPTRVAICGLVGLLLAGSGCLPITVNPPGTVTPGSNLTNAGLLSLSSTGGAGYSGTIVSPKDVDVFDLGAVQPGDRIVLSVNAGTGSSLDPVAALFDTNEEVINYNDDVDYAGGNYDSFIDHTIRHTTDHLYIAITDSAYGPSSGSYSMSLQVTRGGSVPPTERQDVLLKFSGATVTIPGDRTYVIPAFNAGAVDSRLAGQNATVEQGIKQILEQRYAGYDIHFYLEGDPNLPPAGQYSTIVFGGHNTIAFGISQNVDHYNQDHGDESIIFTDQWTAPFSFTPSTNAILTSIGNVAAHELGHLLGLEHTADVKELMDASGSADTILPPQDFGLAALYSEVFPFGFQDDPALLMDTLGAGTP